MKAKIKVPDISKNGTAIKPCRNLLLYWFTNSVFPTILFRMPIFVIQKILKVKTNHPIQSPVFHPLIFETSNMAAKPKAILMLSGIGLVTYDRIVAKLGFIEENL